MAQYSKESPFKEVLIRKKVGAAIYTEIALVAGNIWTDTELEDVIDNRQGLDKEYTGLYRKMLSGTIPEYNTCLRIQSILDSANIIFWRNHPFWKILRINQPKTGDVINTLLSTNTQIRQTYWPKSFKTRLRPYPRPNNFDAICKYKNLDALICLTAYSREPKGQFGLPYNLDAMRCSRKIFPYVISRTPHLFIRWPLYVERFIDLVWSLPDNHYCVSNTSPETDKQNLIREILEQEIIARNNGVPLPPEHLVIRINQDELIKPNR